MVGGCSRSRHVVVQSTTSTSGGSPFLKGKKHAANAWCKLVAESINEDDECWFFTRLRDANKGNDFRCCHILLES